MFSKFFAKELTIENFQKIRGEYIQDEHKQLLAILERNQNFTQINRVFLYCFQFSLFNYAASLTFSKTDPQWVKAATEATRATMIQWASVAKINASVIRSKFATFDSFFSEREFENPDAVMTLDHDICEHGRVLAGPEMDPFKQFELMSYIRDNILHLMSVFGKYKLPAAPAVKETTVLDVLEKLPGFKEQKQAYDLMAPLCADGVETDELPNAQGEFGYDLRNPIPTHTIFGSISYLGKLQNMSGHKVQYERRGSMEFSAVSPHPLDCYAISNPDGTLICELWFTPYHKKNSSKIPKGFKSGG